jgi:2-C-methyl-D-erythritol 4-phosphate cytidylyltransferase
VNSKPLVHALIPAAGRSVRFGGTTLKQYTHLMGIPVISHSIEAVSKHPAVASVTVALAGDDGIYDELVRPEWPEVRTAVGGDSRARTVLNGLKAIMASEPGCEWVMVHDAARPCLDQDSLDRLLTRGLASDSGAILAVPVSDTLKKAGEGDLIETTVDRSKFWAAQTPQLFRAEELAVNLQSALNAGMRPTDEAAAMEFAGVRPLLVRGRSTNIKITGIDDLSLAEFILQRLAVRG